ncbi:MAG: hypothetical protein DDT23_00695 [candidate division WS2 bacterium]|nr:hypothetical protein [Candidatus Lithacetigena glycinireducens]
MENKAGSFNLKYKTRGKVDRVYGDIYLTTVGGFQYLPTSCLFVFFLQKFNGVLTNAFFLWYNTNTTTTKGGK